MKNITNLRRTKTEGKCADIHVANYDRILISLAMIALIMVVAIVLYTRLPTREEMGYILEGGPQLRKTRIHF